MSTYGFVREFHPEQPLRPGEVAHPNLTPDCMHVLRHQAGKESAVIHGAKGYTPTGGLVKVGCRQYNTKDRVTWFLDGSVIAEKLLIDVLAGRVCPSDLVLVPYAKQPAGLLKHNRATRLVRPV